MTVLNPQKRLGLIAGNGQFPMVVLDAALSHGYQVVVAALREETEPEIDRYGSHDTSDVRVHWMGLGQLGRLLKTFKKEGITQAVMAGQVKHTQIFAPGAIKARRLLTAMPDLRMMRLLRSLPRKNTASLIGGVIGELAREGIELLDSTFLLQEWVPEPGILTGRSPTRHEEMDIEYGWPVARDLSRLDLGQTIVVKEQSVVAIEAMEGTDETIRRASRLVGGQPMTVVKVARPAQDMRFDVPVIGPKSLEVFRECSVSALALDAGKTLMLERSQLIKEADRMGLSIIAK